MSHPAVSHPTVSQTERRLRQIWQILPEPLVSSAVGARVKAIAQAQIRRRSGSEVDAGTAEPPADYLVVRTLDQLDERLRFLDAAWAVSDDELRRGFATFRMELDQQMPENPFSDEYRAAVFDLYEWLHGKPYTATNEFTPFDVDACANAPFPYATHSGVTVGNHLIAVGHVIRTLNLPAGSRVLEFGPGWGNTTLALAQMGHHVTAVDIGQNFVDLITIRAARQNVAIEVLLGDFTMIHQLEGTYDAVLFFESFHHCSDHLDLLSGLDRVVAPGGRVLFAAEPVYESWPVPWGLRFGGEALWAIRKNGWLELGFRRSYFLEALERYGWNAERVDCPETNAGEIFVGRRIREP